MGPHLQTRLAFPDIAVQRLLPLLYDVLRERPAWSVRVLQCLQCVLQRSRGTASSDRAHLQQEQWPDWVHSGSRRSPHARTSPVCNAQ
jgi:hypothetical protein